MQQCEVNRREIIADQIKTQVCFVGRILTIVNADEIRHPFN